MSGLAGHSEAYTHAVWLIASLVGALVLVALWFAYRWAKSERELEQAERVIAEHEDSRARPWHDGRNDVGRAVDRERHRE